MNREIKFRGKSLIDGRWIYGDLFRTDLDGGVAIQYYVEVDGWMTENVNPNTVCQLTGVTDGDGRKIYEDDIVAIYQEEHCTFKGKVEYLCGDFIVYSKDGLITHLSKKPWQVIGNAVEVNMAKALVETLAKCIRA